MHLRLLSEGFGHAAAGRVLRMADGIEAACQARPWALGDPAPAAWAVAQFHRSCDRLGVNVVRTLHAMDKFNPLSRRRGGCLSAPELLAENVRLVKAEAALAAALRRPAGGEALLVIHPGRAWRDDVAASIHAAAEVLRRCAERAEELNVRLSLETEAPSHWRLLLGSEIANLAAIAEEVNGWCEARGLAPAAGITLDLEHSLISAWGDEERVLGEIERFGGMVEYVHVVRPLDIFGSVPRPKPLPWHAPAGLWRRRRMLTSSANAHGTVAPPGGDARLERLILAAKEGTNWRRTGVFNFEALPAWYYAPRPGERGTSPDEQVAGMKRLRELLG